MSIASQSVKSRAFQLCRYGRAIGTLSEAIYPSSSFSRTVKCFSTVSTETCPPSRAVIYHDHGAPDQVLKILDIPARTLRHGEVCVKMLAAPINPSDINRIEGVYPVRPPVPAIAGGEGVGEVIAMATGVENLSIGDWVIPAYSGVGTWCTHAVGAEGTWCKVQSDVPMEYAATVTVNPCTALRMMKDFVPLEEGDVVVQNGATSIVGQCVIQLAKEWGVHTINLVRDRPGIQDVAERLKALGATHVLPESQLGTLNIKDLLAGRHEPKLGLNCVGGTAATGVLKLLGESGTMVTYGGMAKKPVTTSTAAFIFKDVRLQGFWLQKWMSSHRQEDFMSMTEYLLGLVRVGRLKYLMEKVAFSNFESALQKALGKAGSAPKQVLTFV
ncbi:hypothetical protein O6H91_15G074700 [Diphasiastrum complanatum]|uniref:Uncharacterized protein n=1 Tax=Diphasiastrum complanatum TaxID=34168 RepID=A0ACC2BJW2_DIPCM|nr:hypothetical protein O6H91_15G074700 [Diphasiastrum complanatum]